MSLVPVETCWRCDARKAEGPSGLCSPCRGFLVGEVDEAPGKSQRAERADATGLPIEDCSDPFEDLASRMQAFADAVLEAMRPVVANLARFAAAVAERYTSDPVFRRLIDERVAAEDRPRFDRAIAAASRPRSLPR